MVITTAVALRVLFLIHMHEKSIALILIAITELFMNQFFQM